MKTHAAALVVIALASPAIADELDPIVGRALFNRQWIPAPSSTIASDGLGPLFNARSCSGCHQDGSGARVVRDQNNRADIKGAVVRFGDAHGRTDPYYGQQLQTLAVPGLASEGTTRFLPRLRFHLSGPALDSGINAGMRVSPSLQGRAAFEDIPDEEILLQAETQAKADGPVKGMARRLGPDGKSGPVGRFGWKASQATLEDQIANAFALDIGMSSPKDPRPYGDCTDLETQCFAMPNGESAPFDGREVSGGMLRLVASYLRSLQAPSHASEEAGSAMFQQSGCAACHVLGMRGSDGQIVKTLSDLLLHDMGSDLDDSVGEAGVSSAQWRTAPLLDMSSPGRRYLHDGRAATIAEAVRAHGGEAAQARRSYFKLNARSRRDLNDYLKRQ
jgi:CxxC motif-containing protein (DUF1111 family)